MIKITKTEKGFAAFRFLLKARGKDKTRTIFTCLFSDGENAVCTDSQRLHMIKLDRDIPAGLYDVITSTTNDIVLCESTVDGQFPNYKQVLYAGEDEPVKLSVWNKHMNGARTLFDIISKGICVNPQYIKDACEDTGELTFHSADGRSPIQITNDFGTACIMPIQVIK